jgi:hypothetical protein
MVTWERLDTQSLVYLGFISKVGNLDFSMTYWATLPRTSLPKPLHP